MSVGVCILAGGLSERMGEDKALMKLPGETQTFLEKVASKVSFMEKKYVSTRDKKYDLADFVSINDMVERIGPMGGIYSALEQCDCEALLVLACDMPYFTEECAQELIKTYERTECDIVLCVSENGMEPLASIYSKKCLPILKNRIAQGDYRLRTVFTECRVEEYALKDSECIRNMNSKEDLLQGGMA